MTWAERPLGEVATLQRGFDLPSQHRRDGRVPIVSSSGPSAFHDEPRVAPPGVVTGRYGTIGQVFYVTEPFWPLNTTLYVRDFHGNDPRFVYYLLHSVDFESCNDKSGVPGVNRNDLHRIAVEVPTDVGEQRAIAEVLGALDDKVELNRQMNHTLEEMASALFKSWFVDFDPVVARADGRKPFGMDAATAALFPDAMQGELPAGWRLHPLSELAEYLSRGIGPSYVEEGGVLVLGQKCVRDHVVDFGPARRHDASKRSVVGRELRLRDVLVNSTGTGTLGRVGELLGLRETTIADSHVTIVRADKGRISQAHLAAELISREAELEDMGEGSTGQAELSRRRLAELPVLTPPVAVSRAFAMQVEPWTALRAANLDECRTLTALRDTLLPKLLSGEVRLKHAERLVEAAL